MVDFYVGYKALFAEGVTELACLAPIRHKFFDLHEASGSQVVTETLRRIDQIYVIEQSVANAEQRGQRRRELVERFLTDMQAWLCTALRTVCAARTVAPSSGTAKAIDYALKRWPALERYTDNSSRPIDSNPVENTIQLIAIDKKIGLFFGSERAGRRAAAKLNCLDPQHWLASVLESLRTRPNSQIDSMLPLAHSNES